MATRPIKKMVIDIHGIRIPVAVMTSSDTKGGLKFTTKHTLDGGEIKQPKICQKCETAVSVKDTVKHYQFNDGSVVEVNSQDFARAAGIRNATFSINEFIPLTNLNPIAAEKTYYLVPEVGAEALYATLAKALYKAKVVGMTIGMIATVERLFAVISVNKGTLLILQQQVFVDNIRPISIEKPQVKITREAVEAMVELISTMTVTGINIPQYEDGFTDRMIALLEKKKTNHQLEDILTSKKEDILEISVLRGFVNKILKTIKKQYQKAG